MGYCEALEAAGAIVKAYQEFGSYQGTWLAYLGDGKFIQGSYGSCSGCDSFEAEFGDDQPPVVGESMWDRGLGDYRTAEQADIDAYQAKLKAFGESYMTGNDLTLEDIVKEFPVGGEYDDVENAEIVAWARQQVENDKPPTSYTVNMMTVDLNRLIRLVDNIDFGKEE